MSSTRKPARALVGLILSGVLIGGCDDDNGTATSADDGGGGAPCDGEVAGAVSGSFSGCASAINHYPEGAFGTPDPFWIYTLVAAPEAGSMLDEPLESLGINLHLAGEPAVGSYSLGNALPDTQAFVYAPYPVAFETPQSLTLTVEELERINEEVIGEDLVVLFQLHGSFEMTLADAEGGTATVTASF